MSRLHAPSFTLLTRPVTLELVAGTSRAGYWMFTPWVRTAPSRPYLLVLVIPPSQLIFRSSFPEGAVVTEFTLLIKS